IALSVAQWSALLTAALLIPALAPLAILKPNLGAALLVARPSRWAIIGSALLLLLSLVILPTWPVDWLRNLVAQRHTIPLLVLPLGPLLLLSMLRLHDWRGRLLLVAALVPCRLLFYDQLALGLIASTKRERLLWAVSGWVTWLILIWTGATGDAERAPVWVLASTFGPALAC